MGFVRLCWLVQPEVRPPIRPHSQPTARRQQPDSAVWAMLVFSEVSSMNSMRGNRFAMKGWHRVIQT